MSTVNGIWTQNENRTATILWSTFTENDTGVAADCSAFPDRTVQVVGTFGGGTIRIEGSIDGTNYSVLHDPQGNALDITSATIKLIAENPKLIRPRATAGAGVNVTIGIQAAKSNS